MVESGEQVATRTAKHLPDRCRHGHRPSARTPKRLLARDEPRSVDRMTAPGLRTSAAAAGITTRVRILYGTLFAVLVAFAIQALLGRGAYISGLVCYYAVEF